MDFKTAVQTCFRKYAEFAGRASRSEFWYFVLFLLIGGLVTGLLDSMLFGSSYFSPLNGIFTLVTILPSLAVTARRLHDIDKSGWWMLLYFIPLVGLILAIVWGAQKGTLGPNRFGPDPLPDVPPSAMPA